MNRKLILTLAALFVLAGGTAYYLVERSHLHAHAEGHEAHGHTATTAESARGPHGGRLLVDGDVSLELAIFEKGVPPEFRAWLTVAGQPVAPADVKLSVTLQRPNGVTDHFTFAPEGDYARGLDEVYEPHSFDYAIVAEHGGRTMRWSFAAPEMQTTLPPSVAQRAGVVSEEAGPATLAETLTVYGHIRLNANRVARAAPRFGGIVRAAHKALGDPVTAGEVVALVETNQSLVTIEVIAPLDGVVIDRDVNPGETVADGAALYTIADFREVWLDLNIPKREHARVKVGQTVTIHADDGGPTAHGIVAWLSPFSSADAQTATARVYLPNPDQRWRPGLFVKADLLLAEHPVAVAVKESALQTLYDFTVVFSQHGDLYQARPLELGRRSRGFVEVRKGLNAGERYVTENSFLIKADIGKSSASHDH